MAEEKPAARGTIATVVATAAVTLAIGVTVAAFGGYMVPAGGGGLTLAVAQGAIQAAQAISLESPSVHCVQPAGNDTIATRLRDGSNVARAVTCATQISGLQVASVLDGDAVIAECRRTGGTGFLVEDESVWHMQARLAREEGIFCEPAGAVSVAAAVAAVERGSIRRDAAIACIISGSGFKDPESVDRMIAGRDVKTIDVNELADN